MPGGVIRQGIALLGVILMVAFFLIAPGCAEGTNQGTLPPDAVDNRGYTAEAPNGENPGYYLIDPATLPLVINNSMVAAHGTTYVLGGNWTQPAGCTASAVRITAHTNGLLLYGNNHTLTGSGSDYSAIVVDADNVTVSSVKIKGWGGAGIYLNPSTNVKVISNDVSGTGKRGIRSDRCVDVEITGNSLTNTSGIMADNSTNVKSSENVVVKNRGGIEYYNVTRGEIRDNTVENSTYAGIRTQSGTRQITIMNNRISRNPFGIYLNTTSSNLTIYNNLLNNTANCLIGDGVSGITWNSTRTPGPNIMGGPELGGNCYQSPGGDGFSQVIADSNEDGFCDAANTIGTGNIDHLPLAIPSLTITTPTGGEHWTQGSTQNVSWHYTSNPGMTVKIEVLRGTTLLATIPSIPRGTAGTGSYPLTFPYYTPLGTDYKVRITSTSSPFITDTSEGPFTIQPALMVISPNGGEVWQPGSTQTLRWKYTGTPGDTVKIEILRSGAPLATLASSVPIGTGGNGSQPFTFPSYTPLGTDYQIRVTSTTYPACTDTSDGYFTISRLPSITVTAPNGGETWPQNSTQTITWSYTEDPGSMVSIELLNGTTVQQVITAATSIGTGGSGSYGFAIPTSLPLGSDYTIRVTSTGNASYTDTSDAAFTVSEPTSIRVTQPNGGETYYLGLPLQMNWSYTGNPGPTVTIEVLKGTTKVATLQNIGIGPAGNGSFSVNIPSGTPVGSDYTIRVTSTLSPAVTDTSDDPFAISGPTIHVESPDGGETFPRGGPLPMSWSYKGNPGSTVNIEVYRGENRVATLQNIPIGTNGAGSYSVPVIPFSTPVDSVYQIKVISTLYADCNDMSNGTFTIS